MAEQALVVAKFARTTAAALLALAAGLEATSPVPDLGGDEEVQLPIGGGPRQQQILELPDLDDQNGMKTADIAYQIPNTNQTLIALERNGLVEKVAGTIPARWRLAPRYRTTTAVFKRVASSARAGEWTTYGDISIAVRGDTKAARGVGAAAAALKLVHPERILMDGGTINPNWRDGEGRGPQHCQQLLEQDGVTFAHGHADAAHRVTWDELRRRDEVEPVD